MCCVDTEVQWIYLVFFNINYNYMKMDINWKKVLEGLFGADWGKTLEFNKIWPRARLTRPPSTNPFLFLPFFSVFWLTGPPSTNPFLIFAFFLVFFLITGPPSTNPLLFCPISQFFGPKFLPQSKAKCFPHFAIVLQFPFYKFSKVNEQPRAAVV